MNRLIFRLRAASLVGDRRRLFFSVWRCCCCMLASDIRTKITQSQKMNA